MSTLLNYAKPSRAARWAARRRGSVLILCVVLIVVLALIGTAMLSTARIDRFTATQHGYNIQIDLLVEGAKNVAKAAITSDLVGTQASGPPKFRVLTEESQTANPPTNYDHWDAPIQSPTDPALQNDQWMASPLPRMLLSGSPGAYTSASPIFWDAITGPLTSNEFEDPVTHMKYSDRIYMSPRQTTAGHPGLRPLEGSNTNTTFTAGDADGDGIADCGLCRLVPGEINGVEYYVGIRIVDNAAKVNVNTAWSRGSDFGFVGGAGAQQRLQMFNATPLGDSEYAGNLGAHLAHVGLMELMNPSNPTSPGEPSRNQGLFDQMNAINDVRFGYNGSGTGTFEVSSVPYVDQSTPRPDYAFITQGNALDEMLSCRLKNPSYNELSMGEYEAFTDAAALAYRFTMLNLEASPSKLEQALSGVTTAVDSVYRAAPNYSGPGSTSAMRGRKSYNADEAALWYDQNFNWDNASGNIAGQGALSLAATTPRPIRAILTTHNPVSNLIAVHDMSLPSPRGIGPDSTASPPTPVQKTDDQVMDHFLMPNYSGATGGPNPAHSVAKTNVNTARFGELWRAYWDVMVDQTEDPPPMRQRTATPFTIPNGVTYEDLLYHGNQFDDTFQPIPGPLLPSHPAQMFRSAMRDMREFPGVYLPPAQQMLLRAAIAAVNTEDLRDEDDLPTRRDIDIQAVVDGATIDVRVNVYGVERQPYITEVYANNDTVTDFPGGRNLKGYVAIELYNPYPEDIDIGGWVLAVIDRRPTIEGAPSPGPGQPGANTYPGPSDAGPSGLSYCYIHDDPPLGGGDIQPPTPLPTGTKVPAHGFLVLHNLHSGTGDPGENAMWFPSPGGISPPAGAVFVSNLHWVMRDENATAVAFREGRGGELVLLRPVNPALPALLENGNAAPVDSFDFTGLPNGPRAVELAGGDPASAQCAGWHYYRSIGTAPDRPNWRFVFPGRYQGESGQRRQQGTIENSWMQGESDPDLASIATSLGAGGINASYPTVHTIQIADGAGPNAVGSVTPNQFPFGGFARNGDILQVTFVGSYRVAFASDTLSTLEVNPITIDSAFGNDTDVANDENPMTDDGTQSREQVGRFCPLRDVSGGASRYNDLDPVGDFDADANATGNKWRYRWALDLFDYLTVQSPGNDYAPNVPTREPTDPGYTPYTPEPAAIDNDGDGTVGNVYVTSPNVPPGHSPGNEDTVPLQGLININTAPARVLSALPMLPVGDNLTYNPGTETWSAGGDNEDDMASLARAIVLWRDGAPGGADANGPFRTIWDLYRVPAFANLQQLIVTSPPPTGPDAAQGDFSPDSVRYDFEEQYLLLNRISNLITTRSDSYTVYLVIEGWQGGQIVTRRRAAFIIDRSPLHDQAGVVVGEAKIENVPND